MSKTPKIVYEAHQAVHNALRRKILFRPLTCSNCHKPCKPEAHHADYSKPLEVTWLCKECHETLHHPDWPFKPASRIPYYQKYHAAHREQRRLAHIAYKAAHPEICAAAEKRWRQKHPRKVKELWKKWYAKNKRTEYYKKYKNEHRAEINAKRREN